MSMKVNPSQSGYESKVDTTTAKAAEQETAAKAAATVDTQDTYEKSTASVKNTTYSPNMNKVDAMKSSFERQVSAFNKMVEGLFSRQAGGKKGKSFDLMSAIDQGNLKQRLQGLEVDAATSAQASAMIAEDGEWGVEQTATRILDFAKALSGGDSSKIETLRKAVEKGFKQAEAVWGGTLPDISQQTYDRVMEGFDAWASEGE